MTTARRLAICGLLLLAAAVPYHAQVASVLRELPVSLRVLPASPICTAYVVLDTPNIAKLTREQQTWLNSGRFVDDAREAGITVKRITPAMLDKLGGDAPCELSAVLAKGEAAGLPCMVLARSNGSLSTFPLPADQPAARKLLGIGGAQ